MSGSRTDVESLGLDDLNKLVLKLLEETATLRAEMLALCVENRRLKGLKGPPSLKASGKDKKMAPQRGSGEQHRRPKNARLAVDQDHILEANAAPGFRVKGYEDFTVQDLVVKPRVIRSCRARWLKPTGATAARWWRRCHRGSAVILVLRCGA
jgi:hypothetical protein